MSRIPRSLTVLSLGVVGVLAAACGSHRPPTYDTPPTLANKEEIVQALRAVGGGLEAKVRLLVHVDRGGQVSEVRLQEGSGDEGLDDAARWIGERMRFRPAQHEGEPVSAWVEVPLTFDVVAPGLHAPRLRNADQVAVVMAADYGHLEGTARLRLRVDRDGEVRRTKITDATSREVLDAARELAYELEFFPAVRGFRRVDTWVEVRFDFAGERSRVRAEDGDAES